MVRAPARQAGYGSSILLVSAVPPGSQKVKGGVKRLWWNGIHAGLRNQFPQGLRVRLPPGAPSHGIGHHTVRGWNTTNCTDQENEGFAENAARSIPNGVDCRT